MVGIGVFHCLTLPKRDKEAAHRRPERDSPGGKAFLEQQGDAVQKADTAHRGEEEAGADHWSTSVQSHLIRWSPHVGHGQDRTVGSGS